MVYGQLTSLFGVSIFLVSGVSLAQTAPAEPAPATDAAAPGDAAPAAGEEPKKAQVAPNFAPVEPPAPHPAPAAPQPTEIPKPPAAPSENMISKFKVSLYGFVEFDIMHDSTQAFGESVGASVLPHDMNSYSGSHGRTHFTARNSRFGFKIQAPEVIGIKTTGTLEMDFFGYQVNPPAGSEASLVSNGTFRMRQANIKAESRIVDVLVGQYYFLFGWQPFFFPATTSFFPVMNQSFGRMPQLRLSKIVKTDDVTFEIAAAAFKPTQRNAEIPEFQGGARIGFNGWKGIHTLGAGGMLNDPLTIGVSATTRQLRPIEWSATPTTYKKATGWGVSFDGMFPVIPAKSLDDAANSLTLTGSFWTGTGIADQVGVPGNVPNAPLPPAMPGGATTPFVADIDNGLVHYDANGNLETIDWTGFMVGGQYYLPPGGHISLTANFTQGWSKTLEKAEYAAVTTAYKLSRYADVSAFFDITPALRTGLSFQYSWQKFPDNAISNNKRFELSVYTFF